MSMWLEYEICPTLAPKRTSDVKRFVHSSFWDWVKVQEIYETWSRKIFHFWEDRRMADFKVMTDDKNLFVLVDSLHPNWRVLHTKDELSNYDLIICDL